jgi:hypothetical protein
LEAAAPGQRPYFGFFVHIMTHGLIAGKYYGRRKLVLAKKAAYFEPLDQPQQACLGGLKTTGRIVNVVPNDDAGRGGGMSFCGARAAEAC